MKRLIIALLIAPLLFISVARADQSVDYCWNIEGDQTTIPEGMYINAKDVCVYKVTPQVETVAPVATQETSTEFIGGGK